MKRTLTLTWTRLALLALAGVLAALAVNVSGLVSVAANTGHFAIVEWFLHSTMRNAVRTQSLPIAVPEGLDLSDRDLVQRAAGHFSSGCASCHGAPGVLQSPAVLAMTPAPPRLEELVEGTRWEDRELFWIVRHGIKYSGMPAWTSQHRPDEIWAMVAFLRALPKMTAQDYRTLALGQAPAVGSGEGEPAGLSTAGMAEDVATALADCARCHGVDGRGVGTGTGAGAFPNIAGQPETYLLETLRAYASGRRESGIMTPAAGVHSDDILAGLAAHYAALTPGAGAGGDIGEARGITLGEEGRARVPRTTVGPEAPAGEVEPTGSGALVDPSAASGPPVSAAGLAELGRRIAEEGLPARKLPACESCHGATGREKNPHYPYLAGQPEWFVATQLQLFKERDRLGTPFAHLMEPIAINLTVEQIDALALHYSRLPAGR